MMLAVDPGTEQSGWVLFDGKAVLASGVEPNADLLRRVQTTEAERLAIEMVASYGMPVGRETFEAVRWIGRFQQAWRSPEEVVLVYRKDVKLHICGSPRAKDGNVRQALLDLLGPPGSKRAPGPTYGVKSHAWAALGVAVTASAA